MIVPLYAPGEWFAVVTDGSVAILPATTDLGLVADVWTSLRDGARLTEQLQMLLRGGIEALPPFALVSVEGGQVHAIVRGAVEVEVESPAGDLPSDEDATTGRFVLLFDPAGQEAWEGTFRVVTLVRASLDPEAGADPMLCEAAWTWVGEALAEQGADVTALGGTVTRVLSQSFGSLAERRPEVEVEIRASWSPLGDKGAHLAAWSTILCTAAGLPPLPDGVTALGRRR